MVNKMVEKDLLLTKDEGKVKVLKLLSMCLVDLPDMAEEGIMVDYGLKAVDEYLQHRKWIEDRPDVKVSLINMGLLKHRKMVIDGK